MNSRFDEENGTHPFFDAIAYPWNRPEAVELHRALYRAIPSPRRIELLYRTTGEGLPPLPDDGPADALWQRALDALTSARKLKRFCELLQRDSALLAVRSAVNAVIEATAASGQPPAESYRAVGLEEWRLARSLRLAVGEDSVHPYVAAAAVLVDFDVQTIQPLGETRDAATSILNNVSQVLIQNGRSRWALLNDVRRKALQWLKANRTLTIALERNPQETGTSEQRIFSSFVRGRWDWALLNTPEQLAAALQATRWLKGIVDGLPPERELTARLSRARFLTPFEKLAGEGFIGREPELRVLNDFVGVPELRSTGEAILSTFRTWQVISKKTGALVVYGMGGVGKSSLIARFILMQEGARLAHGLFPIVYIDFDNTTQSLSSSQSVCVEAARQLAMQSPHVVTVYREMQAAWDEASERDDGEPTAISDFQESLAFWAHWGPQIVKAMRYDYPGPVPFLFVFDTFEEVASKNRLAVSQIFRLVEVMQAIYPELRPVISGRALDRSFGDDLRKAYATLEVKEFESQAAVEYLQKQSGVIDADLAAAVTGQVGRSPLSLKLAAQAIRKGVAVDAKSGFAGLQTTSWLIFSANETVVQGQLYQRILQHVDKPELRKLAHPGLVLRRVTPGLIEEVLAGPCNLALPSETAARGAAARALFEDFSRELSLFESRVGDSVRLNNDVRRVMLALIERQRPEQVEQIHQGAVRYYLEHGRTAEHRAEEIYHRLKCREDAARVFSTRWMPDAGPFLEDALPEFAASVQLKLAAWAGLKLPNEESLLLAADLEDWERVTLRRVQEGLSSNRKLDELLGILSERTERSATSPLFQARARLLIAAGNSSEAIKELERGVSSFAASNDKRGLLVMIQQLGDALDQVGQRREADLCWAQAVHISRELEMPWRAFGAALQSLKRNPADASLQGAMRELLRQMPEEEWRESPQAVREAIGVLGASVTPDLITMMQLRLPPLISSTERQSMA